MLKRRQNEVKRNIFIFDEVKKHSRTSPEIQFKELNEKLRRTLPDHKINWTMPARTQTKSSKNWETKRIKTKLLTAKTLEAFTPQAKFFPFKNSYFKNMFKTNFSFWNWSSIISASPEKYSMALEDRFPRKWTKNLEKKEINCKL